MPKFKFKRSTKGLRENMISQGLSDIGQAFIDAVKNRQYKKALGLMKSVPDINIPDVDTGATALHFGAARDAQPFLAALEECQGLNYLARDAKGRYASELAWKLADNPELGEHLQMKEKEFSNKTGISAWPKPADKI